MANQQSGEPNGQVKNEGMKAAQTSEDETLNDDIDEENESADFDSYEGDEEKEDFSVAGVNDEKAKQKSNVSGGQGTMGNNQSNITQQP